MSQMKRTISYAGMPWVKIDAAERYEDPFSKTNYVKTMAALRATGEETVEDVI